MTEEGIKLKLGISIGDLNGIGCEVALKTFEDSRMLEFCTPVIFASTKTISHQKNDLGIDIAYHGIQHASDALDGKINIVNVWKDAPAPEFGQPTKESGSYAIKSLRAAVKALKNNEIDLLVTAPINKNNIQAEDFDFPGHTDYLAQELQGESLMFMVTENLKIGLLTDHVAVKDVAGLITPELVRRKVEIVMQSLKMDFAIRRPRIAVLGINPHSGDHGVIGKEDDEVLRPVIRKMSDEGMLVYGPYSADSFFGSGTHEKFDAVLAAYHDQEGREFYRWPEPGSYIPGPWDCLRNSRQGAGRLQFVQGGRLYGAANIQEQGGISGINGQCPAKAKKEKVIALTLSE